MKKAVSLLLSAVALANMALWVSAAEEPKTAGLSFGSDIKTEKQIGDLLTPGETYEFPIYFTDNEGKTEQLQEDFQKDIKLRVETKDGKSAVEAVRAVEGDDGYVLRVETVTGWPTQQTVYSGMLKMVKRNSGKVLHETPIHFTVGYHTMDSAQLQGVKNDEFILVDDAAPVITKEQMKKLEQYANGKKVTFTDGDWSYTVRLSDQEAVNMLYNRRIIRPVAEMFEEQQFVFLSFPAGPEFDFTGTMTIDVSEVMEDFENFYVYRYYKGKLTKMDFTLNQEDETLSFETKKLGRFVITDGEIKDGIIVEDGFGGNTENQVSTPAKPQGTGKPNPQMGAL